MPTNAFEDTRISEGTMRAGAQHVSNMPGRINPEPPYRAGGQEVINGHTVKTPVRRVLGTTTLTGAGVRNTEGDSLGKIEDIMIDIFNGQIAYAVLSFGGLFGIGTKLFMVPWSALSFNQRANEFILDIPREVLERAPGFDRDNWPDMADQVYGADVHRHYGKTPYWEHTLTDFSGDEFSANRCCD